MFVIESKQSPSSEALLFAHTSLDSTLYYLPSQATSLVTWTLSTSSAVHNCSSPSTPVVWKAPIILREHAGTRYISPETLAELYIGSRYISLMTHFTLTFHEPWSWVVFMWLMYHLWFSIYPLLVFYCIWFASVVQNTHTHTFLSFSLVLSVGDQTDFC